MPGTSNNSGNGKGWKDWTNQVLLLGVGGALSIIFFLYGRNIEATVAAKVEPLQTSVASLSEKIGELKATLKETSTINVALFTKSDEKLAKFCDEVNELKTLMKLPYIQRKEYYSIPKGKEGRH